MPFIRRSVAIVVVTLLVVLTGYPTSEQAQWRTRITDADQTAIVEKDVAQFRIAQLKETSKTRIAKAADERTVPAGNRFQTTITPPYDVCVGESIQILSSPPAGSNEILEKGFGNASYSCDAERGAINNTILLFGGKDGSILEFPNYQADVSSGMEFDYTPSSTGDLRVDVTMTVNAKTGAAAGSATALVDFRDILLEFLLPAQIGAFVDIAEAVIFEPAAGTKTEAYIYVDTETSRDETTTVVGEHGFAASFPIPPHSQSAEFDSETVTISLTTPVVQGETVYVGTGISTTARVHGWAVAYWNPGGYQETFVVSVALTEENPASNDSTLINNPDFKVLQPGQSDEIVFDIQNTGDTTWTSQQGYTLINTNNESLGAPPIQTLTADVPPGQVARWVIPITAPIRPGLIRTEWQMADDGAPFGAVLSCLVVIVPEDEIDRNPGASLDQWFSGLMERILEELTGLVEGVISQLEEWLQRELDRLWDELLERLERLWREFWENLLRQCCGANVMAPAILVLGIWSVNYRRHIRTRDDDSD